MIYFHNISIYTSLYLNSGVQRGTKSFYDNKHLMIYYLVPSFLYCLYNNLSFMNLSQFDPTTYLLLMQSRLLMTGMVYQVLYKYDWLKWWIEITYIYTVICIINSISVFIQSPVEQSAMDGFMYINYWMHNPECWLVAN